MHQSPTLLLLPFTLLAFLISSVVAANNACNGYTELCNRSFDKVAFPTTHNSYAWGDNIAANQLKDIRHQLDSGIRGFMLDIHHQNKTTLNRRASSTSSQDIYLCHTLCLVLNDGPFVDRLKYFKTFLDDNKQEVITIFIENDGPFTAQQMASSFQAAGLDKYAYQPPSGASSKWPTLQKMIDDNKRLVIFTDGQANPAQVPWILYDKDYVVQTSFTVAVGASFDCKPNTAVRPLWVMNHFVYKDFTIGGTTVQVPDLDSAKKINTQQSIVDQANVCGQSGVFPNFVTVDFYNIGGLMNAVASINKVSYKSTDTNTFNLGSSDSNSSDTQSSATLVSVKYVSLTLFVLLFLI